MSVKIVVDSTVDVTDEVKQQLTVVPLSVHFGDVEYIDGETITHREFYEKLIESDELPTTSQPSPDAFAKVFAGIAEAGDKAVVLTISSKLSGTYQSAHIAAMDYPDTIYIVDSKSAAIGAGVLAQRALELAAAGLSGEAIAERLEQEREDICIVAMLDTLEYLKRGGRISKTAAFAGGLLSIKPVITVKDGEIVILGKARGSRQGNNLLVKEIEQAGGVNYDKPVILGYTGINDALLQKYIQDSAFLWEGKLSSLQVTGIGSAIGTHAGPGAIAVAFFRQGSVDKKGGEC